MKILVTGGAGFIGSYTTNKLISEGNEVIVVDNLFNGSIDNINKKAKFYNIDIRSSELEEVFEKENPEYVFHFAAQTDVQKSFENPKLDAEVNILGTINILKCCINQQIKKIIYSSSAAVYGVPQYLGIDEKHQINPISNYGISKYTSEKYIQVFSEVYGLKYTILRYSNVYGYRKCAKGEGGVISIFIQRILNDEETVIFGDGQQTRDFVYIDDVVKANILSLLKGDNEIINIGTGSKSTINQLIGILIKYKKVNIEPKYLDVLKGDILNSYFNNSKAKNVLGWVPDYTLEEGLKKTFEKYQSIS